MRHVAPMQCSALLAVIGVLSAPLAIAQETQALPSSETSAPETQTSQIEDRKVEQFAAAFVAVQDIQAQAAQQLSDTTDEQQATEVKVNAEKQMIAAVEREGLQVEEFNQIASLLTTDLTLRSRVIAQVERKRKG